MASYRQPGTVLTDHTFSVPLDHGDPKGEHIEIYAREVVAAGRERDGLPWLLYLQGGPGGKAGRHIGADSWLNRALEEYRVLLLDQRGTGRSTPANRQTLPLRGGPAEQARYLGHFRADSIVRDAELVRRRLVGEGSRWSLLGQSFGGFCATAYLSMAPEGLREVFVTGGLPGLERTAEEVYRATYPRAAGKTAAHYARYPQDVAAVRRIVEHLLALPGQRAPLPNGGDLTVEALQSLGLGLGMSTGSHQLHYLLEEAFVTGASGPELSDTFLAGAQAQLSLADRPLFAVLHEASYGQGAGPTDWAAQRVRAEFPAFDAQRALKAGEPVPFTGEMIYPWMFRTDPALRPLREAAELLAARDSWPRLYDPERLARNEVPVAAVVYHDDMYVDAGFSLETAKQVAGVRAWVTNEYEHDGVRVGGRAVLGRLIDMVRGRV
ncbi:alpha/beta hydrolase [Mangrovactinospora gilvigrisea]|uniref:Alpha/beta hydrolase n=1 Tax=Mangrovactinospora gilvigrisea TaxID=1428644 RepID=A0A1J7BBB3_9ACTN|nr:alpha/beta fold hydrolase [Mangrovactinospora gilvigrisea]OIV35975.1 alpha/beta hydrolase [Mangrovactinospora gilvigrisea]